MSVNVPELMTRIRESAARRKSELAPELSRFTLSQMRDRPGGASDLKELSLSPEFRTRRDNHYHVNDLLQFHDREFVRNAYRAILKREPDDAGLDSFTECLRRGRQNKIDILTRLRYSGEGRQRNVRIDGLLFPALVRLPTRAPIIGYVYEWFINLLRMPIAIRHQRQFEAHVAAQQQQIVDQLNRLTQTVGRLAQLTEEVSVLRERATAQRNDLSAVQQAVQQHHDRIGNHDRNILDLAGQAEDIGKRLSENDRLLASHAAALDELRADVHAQHLEWAVQHARLTSSVAVSADRTSESRFDSAASSASYDPTLRPLFLSIENRFRGARDEVKEKFRFYLPYLERQNISTGILDVGCGRGEWLELLTESGFAAEGIDSNHLMVAQCQADGLKVRYANAVDYLRGLPDGSLKAITAFHFVEHVEFADLIEFVDQSIRTLESGGLLILETPNPENVIVSTRNFYLDPSHVRPIPGELLEFVLQGRGLKNIEVVGLHPLTAARIPGDTEVVTRLNDLFYGPMDYCIVAQRP
jgi:2-polyprenyl-3-methyl-5-hydroxy-6-metoxy-1,4-benzoquinol methylase